MQPCSTPHFTAKLPLTSSLLPCLFLFFIFLQVLFVEFSCLYFVADTFVYIWFGAICHVYILGTMAALGKMDTLPSSTLCYYILSIASMLVDNGRCFQAHAKPILHATQGQQIHGSFSSKQVHTTSWVNWNLVTSKLYPTIVLINIKKRSREQRKIPYVLTKTLKLVL